MSSWLKLDEQNVAVLHCKAGKHGHPSTLLRFKDIRPMQNGADAAILQRYPLRKAVEEGYRC